MPVKRDADGNIIKEKTRTTGVGDPVLPTLGRSTVGATVGPGRSPETNPGQSSGYEAQTVLAGSPRVAEGEARTRIYRPGRTGRQQPETPAPGTGAEDATSSAMDDPPVGWLVVVSGPGQGNYMAIGNGSNSVGRDERERVCVDFGDELISRSDHSTITYDPRGKKFYLQHGAGKNLTYLEGKPVLAPTELPGFSRITIGNTELLFIPLCCDQFDWDDYT